jgi:DNA-binding NarL/FixJ family response regulator
MTAPGVSRYSGLRILVVEDDFLVARSLQILLSGLGCEVIGPASTADEACELIRARPVDGALLDIALTPGTSAPVARALLYRGRPFVFVTGYANIAMLPETLASAIHEFVRKAG